MSPDSCLIMPESLFSSYFEELVSFYSIFNDAASSTPFYLAAALIRFDDLKFTESLL